MTNSLLASTLTALTPDELRNVAINAALDAYTPKAFATRTKEQAVALKVLVAVMAEMVVRQTMGGQAVAA